MFKLCLSNDAGTIEKSYAGTSRMNFGTEEESLYPVREQADARSPILRRAIRSGARDFYLDYHSRGILSFEVLHYHFYTKRVHHSLFNHTAHFDTPVILLKLSVNVAALLANRLPLSDPRG